MDGGSELVPRIVRQSGSGFEDPQKSGLVL
jgi:hypothetical protein